MMWFGFFAPFIAWFIQLNASYLVAAHACPTRMWLLHSISITMAVIAGSGLLVSIKNWQRNKSTVSITILLLNCLLLLIILTGEISNLMLEVCQ